MSEKLQSQGGFFFDLSYRGRKANRMLPRSSIIHHSRFRGL